MRRAGILFGLLPLVLLVSACLPGSYPLDIFNEMHYQWSFKKQEPPRLSPPAGAVPITGREVNYTLEQARNLTNPLPRNQQTVDRGRQVFAINCVACHGEQGKGNGIIAAYFRAAQKPTPADLTAEPVLSQTDGEIFWYITNGVERDGVKYMPPWRNLISENDRWALVAFIRSLQGR